MEPLAVMGAQDRLQKAGDGVVAEIGGDVTDAQRPIGITIVFVRNDWAGHFSVVEPGRVRMRRLG